MAKDKKEAQSRATERTVPQQEPSRSFLSQVAEGLAFWGAIAAILFFGVIRKDQVVLGEVLAFCFATFLLFRFPDISKLKVGSVEIERRLQRAAKDAEQVTVEAKATAEQLREVTAALGKVAMEVMAMSNRWGGMTIERKLEIRDELVAALELAGCSAKQVAESRILLERTMRWDLAFRVLAGVEKSKNRTGNQALWDEIRRLRGSDFRAASAGEIRALVTAQGISDPIVLRRLEELERFDQSGAVPDTTRDEIDDEKLKQQG